MTNHDSVNGPGPNVQMESIYRRFSSETVALVRKLTPSDRIIEMNPVSRDPPSDTAVMLIDKNGP